MNRPTQDAGSTRRWPMRTDSSRSAEMDWERIMVQITFAFVIILGYLVSVGVDEATDLAAEVKKHAGEAKKLADDAKELATEIELQKQHNKLLRGVVRELEETEVGEAIAGRVAAEKDAQLETLLRIWEQEYRKRRLYELLRFFDLNAERIPLSTGPGCLPTHNEFKDLNKEIEKVFPDSTGSVSRSVVSGVIREVLRLAEFAGPSAPPRSPEVNTFHFDKKKVTPENLKRLEQQIVWDLKHDRTQIIELQYTLVGRIAAARYDWLAKQPLAKDVDLRTNDTDLGLRMLEEVLKDLRGQMNLLTETAGLLRKGSSSDQPKSTSPK